MHVRREDAVVALGAERVVEQRVDVLGVRLIRLVGHLGGRLVDVDHRAVEVGEAHRHPRAGEHPGAVLDPGPRPVVVVGVEADAVLELHLRLGRPVAPGDAVGAVGDRRIQARVVGREFGKLARVEGLELSLAGEVRAVCAAVQGDLEPLALEGGGLGVGDRGARVDVGGAPHALPVGDRAARAGCRPGTAGSDRRCRRCRGRHRSSPPPPSCRGAGTRTAAAASGPGSSARSGW